MIDIKTITGERLISAPILRDAVIHEELMASDYIALTWNSDEGADLPVGAYIEYEGETYSLYEPYTPTMINEGEYKYSPHFYSRVEAWNKQPACVYTYGEDGVTVKSREFDWSFVGSPADAMQIIKQAIKNEIGEDWSIALADALPANIEISSQTSSIAGVLSDIAAQCETEYWVDKKNNILHLSKCEHGEVVSLEVGSNVGIPSVMSKGNEYYTRYYALGSSRNITQQVGGISGSINKRLTLSPSVFPMGYKDVKGHFENGVFVSDLEQGEIFSKVLLFEDIYPSSDLSISDVRARMKYRLDAGKKVRIGGTDESPIYDQYAIWYFKIKDFAFTEDLLIEGLPLSVHFKSGRLAGQEFELIYHKSAKVENTEGDVIPFQVEAGDYEIKFKESSGTILPDIAYIIPQNSDEVTLFNIEMPAEYTTAAQQRLLEALDREIKKDHEDSNTYEIESNPIAFYESAINISLGQRVGFANGEKRLDTRVLMVEKRLDNTSEQKIRVGNDQIQGSTKELREDVASLNHNVDVLSAFNDLSRSIQDGYGRTQALINEAVASVLGIWTLSEDGTTIETIKDVYIKSNLIVEGDTASGGEGQDTPSSGVTPEELNEALLNYYTKAEVNKLIDEVNAGDIDLTNYYTKQEVYTKEEVNAQIRAIDLSGYALKTELPVVPTNVSAFTNDAKYATQSDVSGEILDLSTQLKDWVEDKGFAYASDLSGYLPTSGGRIDGVLKLNGNNQTNVPLNISTPSMGDTGYIRFGTGESTNDLGYIGFSAKGVPAMIYEGVVNTLIHSGNIGSYALPLSGGTINGNLNVNGEVNASAIKAASISSYDSGTGYYVGKRNDGLGTTDGGLLLYSYGSTPISFYTDGTEKMRIAGNGNVGIGTSSPQYKLDVNGALGMGGIEILDKKSNALYIGYGSANKSSLPTYLWGKGISFINSGGQIRMLMTDGGNVLIGTTTDSGYKLDVNGNTRISGNIIVSGDVASA